MGIIDHVTADGYFFAVGLRRFGNPFYRPQDRRVMGNIILGYFFVCTVNGQHVLHQIVGSYGKEIDDSREFLDDLYYRGNLNHHSDFRLAVENAFSLFEVINTLHYDASCLQELFQRKNHGKHYFQIAICTGAQNSSDLLGEDIFILQ